MSKHSKMPIVQNIKQYFATVKTGFKSKSIILLTLVYTITSFTLSMSFFQVIFLKQSLGFSEMDLSLIPVVTALVSIGLGVFFIPKIKRLSEEYILACSILVRVIGCIALVCIPAGNIPIMLVTAGILASGDYLILTYRDTVLMNNVGEHEKADIFSAVQTLNTLICIPSGYIAGLAFSANPRLPFVLNITIFSVAFVISVLLLQKDENHNHTAYPHC